MSHEDPATELSPAPKFSLTLSKPASSTPAKRPHSTLSNVFADEDKPSRSTAATKEILHFDATSSSDQPPPAAPRVIAGLPNRNWRDETRVKRQKSALPAKEDASTTNGAEAQDVVNGDAPAGGLTVVERRGSASPARAASADDAAAVTTTADGAAAEKEDEDPDREAVDALLGKNIQPTTIIAPPSPPPTEDEAFRQDFRAAPREATLAEYDATPVEGFGAAILRGYLKEGETLEAWSGKQKAKTLEVNRRPGLLGLGAKESGLGVELGAWGKAAKAQGSGSNPGEAGYVPLAMKNKKTGEVVTEGELKEKLEEQKRREKDRSKDRRRRGDEERDSGRSDRERDRRRDDSSSKHTSRRDRHDGVDGRTYKDHRRRDRSRHRDSEDDHDRHRRREKDRDRDRTRDRDRDLDGRRPSRR